MGDRIIMMVWDAMIQTSGFGNLFLTKKRVIPISVDIMKINQKELEA